MPGCAHSAVPTCSGMHCTYESVEGKLCFIFMYVYMCAFVCLNATCVDADRSQKKALNPWALESQVVVSPLAWALGMQLRSFRRTASALKP